MKWFRHITTSHQDEKLSALMDKFGLTGYGFFWLVLELIGQKVDENDQFSISFSPKKWRTLTQLNPNQFRKLLEFVSNPDSFPDKKSLLLVEEKDGFITISCPNILKYRDEYSRKKKKHTGKSPDNIRTLSGQGAETTPENIRRVSAPEQNRTEQNRTEKKKIDTSSVKIEYEEGERGGSTPKPPSPSSKEAGDNGNNPHFPLTYDPKKDKGPALGGKYRNIPSLEIGKFLALYAKIAEESYWSRIPEDRNQFLKAIWPRLSNLWKRYPSLEWWERYFRAVSDNPGIQALVEKGEFVPSLPWLLEEKTVRKYLTGQYTDGEIPKEVADELQGSL